MATQNLAPGMNQRAERSDAERPPDRDAPAAATTPQEPLLWEEFLSSSWRSGGEL
jgi:hypothetical protein